VIYDKQHRPDIYNLKMGKIEGNYKDMIMKYYSNKISESPNLDFST